MSRLPLDDPRWRSLNGAYRRPYDASETLRRLMAGGASEELWEELYTELHHQGDVDQASYASVPWLVEFVRGSPKIDGDALALVATIELERGAHRNPKVLEFLNGSYREAIASLPSVLGIHADHDWDEEVLRASVACIALARGHRWFARAYLELDGDTASRWFSEQFGWDFGDA